MYNHKIEYSWHTGGKKTLITVVNPEEGEDFNKFSEYLVNTYSSDSRDVNIYFFTNRDQATDYVYIKFIFDNMEKYALQYSCCLGYYMNNEFFPLLTKKVLTD